MTQHLFAPAVAAVLASFLLLAAPASAAATAAPAAATCEEQTGPDGVWVSALCYSTTYGRTCIFWAAQGSDSHCL